MRHSLLIALLCFGCSSSNNEAPSPDMATGDVATQDTSDNVDMAASDGGDDVAEPTFCELADCAGDTPVCSELVEACVECASDNDCATAPLRTCETLGVDGADPTYTCVECVDDTVCAGGTCDLDTHTCM